jgi:hypothetical protein
MKFPVTYMPGFLSGVVGFEQQGRLIGPGRQVSVQAIFSNVQPGPFKPSHFGLSKVPSEYPVPLFPPYKMLLRNFFPKRFGVANGLSINLKILFEMFYMVIAHFGYFLSQGQQSPVPTKGTKSRETQ